MSGAYFLSFCLFVAPLMFAVAYVDRHLIQSRCWLARNAGLLTDHFQAEGSVRTAAAHVGLYFALLMLFIGLYWGGHYLSYRMFLSADICVS